MERRSPDGHGVCDAVAAGGQLIDEEFAAI
jgi:hypothetical protein